MQRRIKETDGHRQPVHHLEDRDEILSLHGEDLPEGFFPPFRVVGQDHFAHRLHSLRLEEHVLRADEPDPFRTELERHAGIGRRIGVGSDSELPCLVGPFHDRVEIPREFRFHQGNLPQNDFPRGPVEGDGIALPKGVRLQRHDLLLFVDIDRGTAGDTALAHPPCHDSRMGRHPSPGGENSLGRIHAPDIFGRGLGPDQDHLFPPAGPLFGVFRGENNLADRGAGRCGKTLADDLYGNLRVK